MTHTLIDSTQLCRTDLSQVQRDRAATAEPLDQVATREDAGLDLGAESGGQLAPGVAHESSARRDHGPVGGGTSQITTHEKCLIGVRHVKRILMLIFFYLFR